MNDHNIYGHARYIAHISMEDASDIWRNTMMRTCPICGEEYAEPPAISRLDNHTEICSSCGIRQAVAGLLSDADVEELIQKNEKLYRQVNGF